ncbi:carboxypeptidase regulatory-like domain-containing protein [Streptomyces sp. CA-106131]|uniref:carboxypeptidase regulatory-like domain-containing protein n=1 Tax=Streptomyces sp. CA-106131 TaxID=3240045 RepID=UPI003D932513
MRAPISLLVAALLGAGVLAAGQTPALAAQPSPASQPSRASQPELAPVSPGAVKAPAKTHAPPAKTRAVKTASGAAPSAKLPRTAALPSPANYAPAPCNLPKLPRGQASCQAMLHTRSDHRVEAQQSGPPAGSLGPSDIQAAYRLPQGGQGKTVAIIDAFGDSNAESDLAAFRAQYGLPACTTGNGCFTKLDQNGGTNYPIDDAGWATETSLDLDAVSAACPQCNIMLVQGTSASEDDLGTAVDTAVRLGAKYVSNSYGVPGEESGEGTFDHYFDHPGVVITASSGDSGNVTLWPASNPHVTAVGGTTLNKAPDTSRGWDESAWAQGGSGCSKYEPKPAYQESLDTACANRATADISAVADPATGLAVYDTLGQGGWLQVGGTSLSSPLVAAMYALAGTPKEGTYPVEYPYFNQANGLFDVTTGSDGNCGNQLCTAVPGWDGPTGLGTPDGVSALAYVPRGALAGSVTDQASGSPLGGLTVTATSKSTGSVYRAVTDAQGHYSLPLPAGTYDLGTSTYGYSPVTRADVAVGEGQTVTADLVLTKLPSRTVSGTVTDGSGHGWPLYAKITVDGYPNGAIWTDPYTGAYSVDLPSGSDYTMHVAAVYPGYRTVDQTVTVAGSDVRENVAMAANHTECLAPGYAYAGTSDFENWKDGAPTGGWTVTDNNSSGSAWESALARGWWNFTGGSGDAAIALPIVHNGKAEDTTLTSPALDFTHQTDPTVAFDMASIQDGDSAGQAQLSLDGGATWSTVWETAGDAQQDVKVPLPGAAGKSDVRLRFHFAGGGSSMLEVDAVRFGSCMETAGGLVAGIVTDGNTKAPKNDATITDTAAPAVTAVSSATPLDAAVGDGFYWLFSPRAGDHTYTATATRYAVTSFTAKTAADGVTQKNVALQAGRLAVSQTPVSVTEAMGQSASRNITLTNSGTAPLHVAVGEQNTGFTPADRSAVGSWSSIARYPEVIAGNTTASYQGKIYSVAGWNAASNPENTTLISRGYVYDPATAAWAPIASLPQALAYAGGSFLNGTFYVVGGEKVDGTILPTVYAYHPATDTWSRVADLPQAVNGATVTTLGGKLYAVGGCPLAASPCGRVASAQAYSFDPAHNVWTRIADYPVAAGRMACAGVDAEIVCNGGLSPQATNNYETLKSTYIYHPATGTWSQGADAPYAAWAMSYSASEGRLQIAGGSVQNAASSRSSEYDPVSDTWSALPDAPRAYYAGGTGGCGLIQVGSAPLPPASGIGPLTGTRAASTLPGYDQCDDDHTPWMSESATSINLAAGQSVTVTVTADSSKVSQPGSYAAQLTFTTDAPYARSSRLAATLQATPPKTWGKVSGTVTDAATKAPLAGATVQICTMYHAGKCGQVSYTLKTDAHGRYQMWLDKGYNPLFITVTTNGYQPKSQQVRITAGGTAVADFALAAI